jgi:hypothetical protein
LIGKRINVSNLKTFFCCGPFVGVVHEEKVEEPQPGSAQPGELVLEVVVRLVLQGEVLQSFIYLIESISIMGNGTVVQ